MSEDIKSNKRSLTFSEFLAYVDLQRKLFGSAYAKRVLTKYLPLYYNIDSHCILYGHEM